MAINPTNGDIGRAVVYRKVSVKHNYDLRSGTKHTNTEEIAEQGVITSFNEHWIFVRYGSDPFSRATRRSDLDWMQNATHSQDQGEAAGAQTGNSESPTEQK